MPKVNIEGRLLNPILEQLAIAIQWLQPGAMQYRYCQLKNALTPAAKTYAEAEEALINACAKYEGEGDERKRVETITELANGGKNVSIQMENPKEFGTRYKELGEQQTEVNVPILLDFDLHIKNFTKDKVATPPPMTVDFSLLMPLIKDTAVISDA